MTTRSQTSSTSESKWLLKITVLPRPGQRQDQVLDFAAADGVQAGGRLVEDNQFGIVDQGLGQADAALHALGEFADHAGADGAQADHFQKLLGAAAALGGRQVK